MVKVRLENKPAFDVIGIKTWISKVEDFHNFWNKCHENNTISTLKSHGNHNAGAITQSLVFGVSRVENDPNNRDFYFYIATEYTGNECKNFETFTIPASQWAIFESKGPIEKALFEAEMYVFKEWLPSSGYIHAKAPELEVYPLRDSQIVEFWLPIKNILQLQIL